MSALPWRRCSWLNLLIIAHLKILLLPNTFCHLPLALLKLWSRALCRLQSSATSGTSAWTSAQWESFFRHSLPPFYRTSIKACSCNFYFPCVSAYKSSKAYNSSSNPVFENFLLKDSICEHPTVSRYGIPVVLVYYFSHWTVTWWSWRELVILSIESSVKLMIYPLRCLYFILPRKKKSVW